VTSPQLRRAAKGALFVVQQGVAKRIQNAVSSMLLAENSKETMGRIWTSG